MYTHIIIEKEGGIASLILNRPEQSNAFDEGMISEFHHALTILSEDPTLRVLLLQARGKHFSAGADLNWMRRVLAYNEAQNLEDARKLADLMYKLARFPTPTIALVQGATYGGGVGLVACCDLALASPSAIFCLSEIKLGLIPAVISPYVIRAIGERAAHRYFLTAESFTAEHALHLGLVHEVVPEDLITRARALAEKICENAPRATRAAKDLIFRVAPLPEDLLIQDTVKRIAEIRVTPEAQEGLKAFLEKRKPKWEEMFEKKT